jgi:hypothetical protein
MTKLPPVPHFSEAADDGIPSSPLEWAEIYEEELALYYRAHCEQRSLPLTGSSYMIWCFKRYERYLEACAQQLKHWTKD